MSRRRSGFTLIELLVVIAIIAVLIALLLPAVQQAREAARRSQCKNNLKQLGLGMHNYNSSVNVFPPGYVTGTSTTNAGYSWGAMLLPYIDQAPLYQQINFLAVPAGSLPQPLTVFKCPSDPQSDGFSIYNSVSSTGGTCSISTATTQAACATAGGSWSPSPTTPATNNYRGNYVGSAGSTALSTGVGNGIYFINSNISFAAITDGSSNTFLAGERNQGLGSAAWGVAVGDDSLGPTGSVVVGGAGNVGRQVLGTGASNPQSSASGFGSMHVGGCHMLMGDGAVKFISNNINNLTFQYLSSRNDGNLIGDY